MSLPQRLGYVTLGARSMTTLRAFYARLGWVERPGSNDEFATYEMGPPCSLSTRSGYSARMPHRERQYPAGRGAA